MQFSLGTEKGGVGGVDPNTGEPNTVVQDPFYWAPMSEARMNYTSEKVQEKATAGNLVVGWTPVAKNSFGVVEKMHDGTRVKDFENAYDVRVVPASGGVEAKGYVKAGDTTGTVYADKNYTTQLVVAEGDKVYYA